MGSQQKVMFGGVFVVVGCVWLLNSWEYIQVEEREFLPLPAPNESQIANQCKKYYLNYGYKLIRG